MDGHVVVDMGSAPDLSPEGPPTNQKLMEQREHLVALLWLEGQLKQLHRSLDEKAYIAKVDATEKAMAAQEELPGLSRMLGNMRRQMHQFAAPIYREAVDEEIQRVEEREKVVFAEVKQNLQARSGAARQAVTSTGTTTLHPAHNAENGTDGLPTVRTAEDAVGKHEELDHPKSATTGMVIFGISLLLALGLVVWAYINYRKHHARDEEEPPAQAQY